MILFFISSTFMDQQKITNQNKTEAIWIVSKRNHKPGTLPVIWSKGDFLTLGIWFNSEDENNS